MPLPKPSSGLSPAGADLGLGDMLGGQVKDETEELRKKRMAQQQQGQYGAAAYSLLGGMPGGA